MNRVIGFGMVAALMMVAGCASPGTSDGGKRVTNHVVDAGCGQCLMGLKEKKGCDLAVRLDGKAYFVDGFTMKQMGDAHANDGMCNTLRKAKVTGDVSNGRFAASKFELLALEK